MTKTRLKISTPYGLFFDEDIEIITLKTPEGYIGLQANHLPFISSLEISSLEIKIDQNNKKIAAVGGGLVFVERKSIDIFTDDITWKEDIDKTQLQKEIDELHKKINEEKTNNVQRNKNELVLKKALNRLETLRK